VNFQLNITTLQETVDTLDKAITEAATIDQEFSKAQGDLIRSSWHGKAADRFSVNSGEWKASFKVFRQNIEDVTCLLKKVLPLAKDLHREAEGFGAIFGAGTIGHSELLSYCASAKGELSGCCTKLKTRYDAYRKELNELTGINSKLSYSQLSLTFDIQSMLAEAKDNQEKLSRLTSAADTYASGIDELEFMIAQGQGSITRPEGWAQFTGAFFEKIQGMGLGALDALAGSMSAGELLAQLLGLNFTSCAYGGDPVNMATGNFVYEKEFLASKGLMPLSFKMFYNAQEKEQHGLGPGWMHSLAVFLQLDASKATLAFEDGRREYFVKNKSGAYIQSQNLDNHLYERGGRLEYVSHEGLSYIFDKNGRLLRKEDRNSNHIELFYSAKGVLEKVQNNSGQTFHFEYEKDKLVKVSDSSKRTVSFIYTDGNLVCITDENSAKHQFAYDDTNKLSKIINPQGITTLSNTYEENHRMKEQVFPDGGAISYLYDDEENKLVLTEQNGNEVVYIHDDMFRSVETVYSDGSDKYEYNDMNLRTSHTDKRGNTTKYSYDRRGNLIKSENALGERLLFEYNHLNKPTRVRMDDTVTLSTRYDKKGNAVEVVDALGRTTKLEYNEDGQPSVIIQPDSSEIHLNYDERGNIQAVVNPYSTITYAYDELNRVIETTDGEGNKTSYEHNKQGDITKVTNAEGRKRIYEYNSKGKVAQIVDFDNSTLKWEYNCLGKPSKTVNQEGSETNLEYDLMWNVSRQTDALGNTTSYEYDRLNRLESVTNARGATVKYAYDPNGNKTEICGPEGEKISLAYDPLNRVKDIVEPSGAKTSFAYNRFGQVTQITDAVGQKNLFAYDKAGQMTSKEDPSGSKTSYTYTPLGKINEITDKAGRITKHEYFPGGLLKKIHHPDGRSTMFSYDKNKNLLSQASQDGYALYYDYDCLNQIIRVSSNCGQVKTFTYDATGNVAAVVDTNGNTTRYAYSPTGKLTSVIDALGCRSEYEYDKLGNLTKVEQFAELHEAQGINKQNSHLHITRYMRSELGQIEKVIDSLGNSESYTYDMSGNLGSKLDKEGYLTQYGYDLSGQLEQVTYADGKSVYFSYNALKQLTEIKDWLGITTIELDEAGRALKVVDHNGKRVEYTYGSSGEKTSIVYPDGKTVTYLYDEALRLKTLNDGNNRVSYIYDKDSRLAEKSFSNGLSTRFSYNDVGLLSELVHSDSQGVLDRYAYAYDNSLNKTSIDKYRRNLGDDSGEYQYTYDALSRLTGVAKDGEQIREYGFDGFGNRDYMVDRGVRTEYSYNSLNQLLRAESPELAQDFIYDARGNLTRILEGDTVIQAYDFSPLNRLAKAANASGQVASYDYNGLGFRVGKQTAGALCPTNQISYVLDLTKQYHNLLQVTDNEEACSFSWDDNVVFSDGSAFLRDELGSPLRYYDEGGTLLESYGYDEFGNVLLDNQGAMQPFGYSGFISDSVTGTYFAQEREYHPMSGRFTSVDRIKGFLDTPITMNNYIYCFENPMKYTDDTGRFPWLLPVVIGGLLLLTGCSQIEPEVPSVEIPPATSPHVFQFSAEDYNDEQYVERTNCYAYAFDTINNPVTNQDLKTRTEASGDETYEFALQPGLLSGQFDPYDATYISGTPDGNQHLIDLATADAKAMGLNFQAFQPGMTGGYAVLLVVMPNGDYHWYREDGDGTWSHKRGGTPVISGVIDPVQDAISLNYTEIVGFFYITKEGDCNG